jgi:hypothetical protein
MDVIMDSVAQTRDRLNRLGKQGDGEVGPNSRPISRRCHHGKLSRNCGLCDRERKIESLDRLCSRQSAILTGVANTLRGDPDETSTWSHHDLVERVQAVIDESRALRAQVEDLQRERQQTLAEARLLANQELAQEETDSNERGAQTKTGASLAALFSQRVSLASQPRIVGLDNSAETIRLSDLSSVRMGLNRLFASGIHSAKRAAHTRRGNDWLVQGDGAGRSIEPGVPKGEHASVRGHQPVTK